MFGFWFFSKKTLKFEIDINEIPRKKHKVDEENIERKITENQEQNQPAQKKRKIIKGTSQRKRFFFFNYWRKLRISKILFFFRGKMLDMDIIISNLFECIDDYQ